jgi:hypothetical protein
METFAIACVATLCVLAVLAGIGALINWALGHSV